MRANSNQNSEEQPVLLKLPRPVKSQDEFLKLSVILVVEEFPFIVPERRARKKFLNSECEFRVLANGARIVLETILNKE